MDNPYDIANANQVRQRDEDDPQAMLEACKEEIQSLWRAKDTEVFKHSHIARKVRKSFILERHGAATYFLDVLDRISQPDYRPTDEDIMNTRVRTVGVTEHVFDVGPQIRYRVFDVGGDRSQRAAWAPFLNEQLKAVLFVAPIGAYDQRLQEDPSINRVQDSLDLFRQVAGNPLLQGASIILLLNKIDILQLKIRRGISVRKHWPAYTGDDTDHDQVWRWFRARFTDVANARRQQVIKKLEADAQASPRTKRSKYGEWSRTGVTGRVYIFPSCAVDVQKVKSILTSVQDTIVRANLIESGLV